MAQDMVVGVSLRDAPKGTAGSGGGREVMGAGRVRTGQMPKSLIAKSWTSAWPSIVATPLLPIVLLLLWYRSAECGWISNLVLPHPRIVAQTFCDLWGDHTIQSNICVSFGRIARGFAVGSTIGLVLGMAFAWSHTLRTYVQPTFAALCHVNVLASMPFLILIFGIDEPLKTAAIAWATMIPVVIHATQSITDISPKWFELARVHQLRPVETLRWIIAPAAIPVVFTGLRMGLSAAWIALIVAEMVASSEGIGFMVVWGRQLFQLDVVIVSILVIGVIGITLDLGLRGLERLAHTDWMVRIRPTEGEGRG